MTKIPNLDRLRRSIRYDADTGHLYWIDPNGRPDLIGKRAGSVTSKGHRCIGFDGSRYKEHIICWYIYYGEWPSLLIDHKNEVKDDNRIDNLRLATKSQNNITRTNLRKDNNQGFPGLMYDRRRKTWAYQYWVDKTRYWTKTFRDKDECITEAKRLRTLHYGEFA